jgi:hypothetical protein
MAEVSRQTVNNFPIGLLHKAFYILENKGHSAFRNYINHVGMPSEDIERVLSKYNYIHDPEYRVKINKLKEKFIAKIKGSEFEIKEMPF